MVEAQIGFFDTHRNSEIQPHGNPKIEFTNPDQIFTLPRRVESFVNPVPLSSNLPEPKHVIQDERNLELQESSSVLPIQMISVKNSLNIYCHSFPPINRQLVNGGRAQSPVPTDNVLGIGFMKGAGYSNKIIPNPSISLNYRPTPAIGLHYQHNFLRR